MLANEQNLVGYDGLRFAIVMSAARDYKRAIRYVEKHPNEESKYMNQMKWLKSSCESFFRGKWFKTICELDGERFIQEVPKLEEGFRDKGGRIRDVI